MVSKTEKDQFLTSERRDSSSKCYSIYWNQGFRHQQIICRIIESFYFQAFVIFLVVFDTALVITEVMLDSYKVHHECEQSTYHLSKEQKKILEERIELAMEIAHFASIGILGFFVIELIIRIYASGKEFWNIRKNKMEYFDAFIVITSLIIDLYGLYAGKEILADQLMLIFVFRLWRFIRIISSVTEGVRHGERKHKQHLNKGYLGAIHRLTEIIKCKTTYIQNTNDDFNSILEYFQMIDNQCQLSLDELDHNHELTSSVLVEQFIEQLNGLENKNKNEVISTLFIKSPIL